MFGPHPGKTKHTSTLPPGPASRPVASLLSSWLPLNLTPLFPSLPRPKEAGFSISGTGPWFSGVTSPPSMMPGAVSRKYYGGILELSQNAPSVLVGTRCTSYDRERASLESQKHPWEGKMSGPPPRRTKRHPGVRRNESGSARPPSSSILSAAGEMSSQFFLTPLVRAQMKLASHWTSPRSGCCGTFLYAV